MVFILILIQSRRKNLDALLDYDNNINNSNASNSSNKRPGRGKLYQDVSDDKNDDSVNNRNSNDNYNINDNRNANLANNNSVGKSHGVGGQFDNNQNQNQIQNLPNKNIKESNQNNSNES